MIAEQYFTLTERQLTQLKMLPELYQDWNAKINVISRQDVAELDTHHILHSLAIAKCKPFKDGVRVLDLGTGGGFPGIPLAILFPKVKFVLADRIGKKIKVVSSIVSAISLSNVTAVKASGEEITEHFDYVVARAVTRLDTIWPLTRKKITPGSHGGGLIYLKGGDFQEELKSISNNVTVFRIDDYFKEPYFKSKFVIFIAAA